MSGATMDGHAVCAKLFCCFLSLFMLHASKYDTHAFEIVKSSPPVQVVPAGSSLRLSCTSNTYYEYCLWTHRPSGASCIFEWKRAHNAVKRMHCSPVWLHLDDSNRVVNATSKSGLTSFRRREHRHNMRFVGNYERHECAIQVDSVQPGPLFAGDWSCEMEAYVWGVTRGSTHGKRLRVVVLDDGIDHFDDQHESGENAAVDDEIVDAVQNATGLARDNIGAENDGESASDSAEDVIFGISFDGSDYTSDNNSPVDDGAMSDKVKWDEMEQSDGNFEDIDIVLSDWNTTSDEQQRTLIIVLGVTVTAIFVIALAATLLYRLTRGPFFAANSKKLRSHEHGTAAMNSVYDVLSTIPLSTRLSMSDAWARFKSCPASRTSTGDAASHHDSHNDEKTEEALRQKRLAEENVGILTDDALVQASAATDPDVRPNGVESSSQAASQESKSKAYKLHLFRA